MLDLSTPVRIVSVGGFLNWWGNNMPPNILELDDPKAGTVGGGEEAMIRTAVGLAEHGHDVTLYWCGMPGEWRGVKFKGSYEPLSWELARNPPDVVIGWSTIIPFQFVPKTTLRLFAQQLNDCWCPGDWDLVDCVVSPSRSHAEQLHNWGYKNRPWTVVHNGIDAELYYGATPWSERPLNVGHWSSPDRGLHHLLDAWPEVVKQEPRAHLHVFYEIDKWFNSGSWRVRGPLGDRARKMFRETMPRAKADASITFHGAVPRRVLAKTQVNCRVQCYPCDPVNYTEGFAIAAAGGIAAGCHVLTTKRDALPSLYEGSVTWLPDGHYALRETLPEAIVNALHTPPKIHDRFKYTWANAALQMERAVNREWDRP